MATKSIFDCDSSPKSKPSRELVSYDDDDDFFSFGCELPEDEVHRPKSVSISVTVNNDFSERSIKRKPDELHRPRTQMNKKRMSDVQNRDDAIQPERFRNPSSGEYSIIGLIGSGTYGQVFKARLAESNIVIAVKRMHIKLNIPNLYTNLDFMKREFENLNELDECPYIVRLLKGREEKMSLNDLQVDLLFEYCPYVLKKVIENRAIHFHLNEIKGFLRQMLLGLDYMHEKSIMHRDFKTENILLTIDGVVKIADFGLSRKINDPSMMVGKEKYTPVVVTQWYRAPEILLLQSYNELCDMWSFGCVMGEFWHRSAILPGKNEIDQIKLISKLCGSSNLPKCTEIQLPNDSRKTRFFLKDKLPRAKDDQINIFFDQLMICNPEKRLTASKAMNRILFLASITNDNFERFHESCHSNYFSLKFKRFQKFN